MVSLLILLLDPEFPARPVVSRYRWHSGVMADPQDYGWLVAEESALAEDGCVMVAAGLATSDALEVFGALADEPETDADEVVEQVLDQGRQAAGFTTLAPGAALVVEILGFEGSRDDVLAAASVHGPAASVTWDVEGMVLFSWATGGEFLGTIELMDVLEYLDDLDVEIPVALMPLLEHTREDDVPLVAVGAALVATFTGHEFTADDVAERTRWYPLDGPGLDAGLGTGFEDDEAPPG